VGFSPCFTTAPHWHRASPFKQLITGSTVFTVNAETSVNHQAGGTATIQ
jgi:hypothetical protein